MISPRRFEPFRDRLEAGQCFWVVIVVSSRMRLLFLFFLLSFSLSAESIHWWGSYEKAFHAAQKMGKPMMVLAVEPNCPQCNALIRDVLSAPKVVRRINDRYVSVIVTHDRWRHYPNELYFTTQFPTLFLVNPQDEQMERPPLYGYTDRTESLIKKTLGL